ncbi:MAG: LEA type 2 family protein [Gemmatimonadaceae bacterium]
MRKTIAFAAAAAIITGAGCKSLATRTFAEPVVTFRDVKINGLGLTGGSLDINLSVYNPNGYDLDATRLTYKLWVDSLEFGTGAIDKRFTVQEKDSSIVALPLNFNWQGVGSAGRELLNTGSVNYRVTGDITVRSPLGNHTLPYDRTGRFSTLGGNR